MKDQQKEKKKLNSLIENVTLPKAAERPGRIKTLINNPRTKLRTKDKKRSFTKQICTVLSGLRIRQTEQSQNDFETNMIEAGKGCSQAKIDNRY